MRALGLCCATGQTFMLGVQLFCNLKICCYKYNKRQNLVCWKTAVCVYLAFISVMCMKKMLFSVTNNRY